MDHPYILKIEDSILKNDILYFIYKKPVGLTIFDYVNKNKGNIPEQKVLDYIK